jgi:hypothetical protein
MYAISTFTLFPLNIACIFKGTSHWANERIPIENYGESDRPRK